MAAIARLEVSVVETKRLARLLDVVKLAQHARAAEVRNDQQAASKFYGRLGEAVDRLHRGDTFSAIPDITVEGVAS